MKKNALPDSFKKRKLLFESKTIPEQLIALGQRYMEADRLNEASEFFRKAAYKEGLEDLKALAQRKGDSFLYHCITRQSVQDEAWRQGWKEVGRQAMALQKYSHAVCAFQKAENKEALKKAEEALKEVLTRDQT